MVDMVIGVFEILTLSVSLTLGLLGIWAALLRKDFREGISGFRKALRKYKKKIADDLWVELEEERAKGIVERKGKVDREATLDLITVYTDSWTDITSAVEKLREKEEDVHKRVKWILVLLALTFLGGFWASYNPLEVLSTEPPNVTRIDLLLGLFMITLLVSLHWVWKLISFNRILSRIGRGDYDDFKEVIDEMIDELEKEYFTHQLSRFEGKVSEAASKAGISRQNFTKKLKKHSIRRSDYTPRS